jgi:hypothetical protein
LLYVYTNVTAGSWVHWGTAPQQGIDATGAGIKRAINLGGCWGG